MLPNVAQILSYKDQN